MIVGVQGVGGNNSSDAASITNTLVSDTSERQKIPHHLLKLIYASLFVSTLALTFSIVDAVTNFRDISDGVVGTVLPFVFTLPHHCATFLLKWLQRHHTASIFPFAPSSPRAIAYSIVLVGAWLASTALCAMSLRSASAPLEGETCVYLNATGPPTGCTIFFYRPNVEDYWTAVASTLTSALELLLILSITLVCYLHYRRQNKTVAVAPSPAQVTSESKALSV